MDQSKIRNFSIIAHIDHGKSTLADRILEMTETVSERDMRAQLLDSMDLERERGITIKAQAVRVAWKGHELNLIDTPGHVDFTYEVSRSLQACEGALLVVDAAQGIEAQTLANAYLAIENGLEIVPVVNKIDLPSADPDGASQEVADLLGDDPARVVRISAKTGLNVTDVLDAIIERVPAPAGDPDAPPRALVFDSSYDQYRGVLAFVRVIDGSFSRREELQTMATGTRFDAEELGFFSPTMTPVESLSAGEVGYVVTGLEGRLAPARRRHAHLGRASARRSRCPGYKDVKPMVFAGLFPTDSDAYPELRDALERLKLNDGALFYEPETSKALGFGFRCGFLGLLHMEIVRERLEREFDLDLLVTAPTVAYRVQERHDTRVGRGAQPRRLPARVRGGRGAVRQGVDHRPEGVRRRRDGAQQRAPRHVRPHGVPLARARAPHVRPAARRDRARLLRPAEVAHARLRIVRLRPRRLQARQARARRRARRRRDGRCAVADHPSRLRVRARQAARREAARGDPAPDVRRADPGRDRLARDRARDGEGAPQGRAREVLRRRHLAQAQAAREAEEGQEADEAGRRGRGAAGGVPRRAQHRAGAEDADGARDAHRLRTLRRRARAGRRGAHLLVRVHVLRVVRRRDGRRLSELQRRARRAPRRVAA